MHKANKLIAYSYYYLQENSSLQQMGNSGLLDLFNGNDSGEKKNKKTDQSKKGQDYYSIFGSRRAVIYILVYNLEKILNYNV